MHSFNYIIHLVAKKIVSDKFSFDNNKEAKKLEFEKKRIPCAHEIIQKKKLFVCVSVLSKSSFLSIQIY